MRKRRHNSSSSSSDYYWPSFTDMMVMIVLVMLFITLIAFVQAIYNAYEQTQIKQELAKTADIKKQLSDLIEQKLEENVGKDQIVRGPNNTISIEGDILFPTGSAVLSSNGKAVLASLSEALVDIIEDNAMRKYLYIILIEGHTDKVPYDNWTLSTERAVAVVKYLQTINPLLSQNEYARYLAATGYSQYKPVAEGSSETALAQNRRISFQIILDDQKWQNKLMQLLNNTNE